MTNPTTCRRSGFSGGQGPAQFPQGEEQQSGVRLREQGQPHRSQPEKSPGRRRTTFREPLRLCRIRPGEQKAEQDAAPVESVKRQQIHKSQPGVHGGEFRIGSEEERGKHPRSRARQMHRRLPSPSGPGKIEAQPDPEGPAPPSAHGNAENPRRQQMPALMDEHRGRHTERKAQSAPGDQPGEKPPDAVENRDLGAG